MTFVFITPPSMRLGENVVCVQAWRWAAAAGAGQRGERGVDRVRVEQRRLSSSGTFSDSTRAGHSSWKRGAGR